MLIFRSSGHLDGSCFFLQVLREIQSGISEISCDSTAVSSLVYMVHWFELMKLLQLFDFAKISTGSGRGGCCCS